MKYRLYIDEVGNPDLESSENPNHRFLSLTGVILDLSHVQNLVYPQMEALKAKYFLSHPDDPVIFHRKEMHASTWRTHHVVRSYLNTVSKCRATKLPGLEIA